MTTLPQSLSVGIGALVFLLASVLPPQFAKAAYELDSDPLEDEMLWRAIVEVDYDATIRLSRFQQAVRHVRSTANPLDLASCEKLRPLLLKSVQNLTDARYAATALAMLRNHDTSTLKVLRAVLRNPKNEDRAAVVLPLVAGGFKEAEPEIVSLLLQGSLKERAVAARGLGLLRLHDAKTLEALASALTNGDAKLSSEAALALGNIGEAASSTVPELIKAFLLSLDKDPHVCATHYLAQNIPRIGDAGLLALSSLVGDARFGVRNAAAGALSGSKNVPFVAVKALATLLANTKKVTGNAFVDDGESLQLLAYRCREKRVHDLAAKAQKQDLDRDGRSLRLARAILQLSDTEDHAEGSVVK